MAKNEHKHQRDMPFHTWPSKKVLEFLHARPEGFTSQEAKERIERFGENVIEREKAFHPIFLFLKQFNNVLIYILLVAASVSYLAQHFVDVFVILGVVIFNAIIGFILEYRAERSVEALKNIMASTAKVLRDNRVTQIESRWLVPGDIVFVREGDMIPADGRLLFSDDVRTVESALTGEASPQTKDHEIGAPHAPLADRTNMLWMGTYSVSGEARMVVTATGSHTQLGLVARDMEAIKEVPTHFHYRVRVLAMTMGFVAVLGTLATFFSGYYIAELEFLDVFLAATAALVSGIPEGLPAILSIVLVVSALRMSKKNAIVRSLPSIETLAVVDTILTDKTGTLTENTMNIVRAYIPAEEEIMISGNGWENEAIFSQSAKSFIALEHAGLRRLIHIAGLSNAANVYPIDEGEDTKKNGQRYEVIGDPTEAALVVFARRAGVTREALESFEKILDDLAFRSDRQYRATLVRNKKEDREYLYVVGAPEVVMKHCRFIKQGGNVREITPQEREDLLEKVRAWSENALRVLACAYRERLSGVESAREEDVRDLVIAGLVGMMDTPRSGVADAVAQAQGAGIRVIMTTGDHKETALAIAKQVGIAKEDEEAFTQEELERLNEKEFLSVVSHSNVFARLTPKMKYRITEVLQSRAHCVAVTGDGVNDALALRKADIGVAMGKNGSDVAKSAGSIILVDDNFATIVRAVEEGRIVFNNVQRSGSFLITTNFAEHVTIIGALSFALPLPLLPTQILLLNLMTDSFPAMALATEPGHGRALKRPPMKSSDQILSPEIVPYLLTNMVTMAVLSLVAFIWFLPEGEEKARTAVFVILSATQLFNVFNMRSLHRSVFSIGLLRNRYVAGSFVLGGILLALSVYIPFIQKMFGFVSLSFFEFFTLFLVASLVLFCGEAYKWMKYGKR